MRMRTASKASVIQTSETNLPFLVGGLTGASPALLPDLPSLRLGRSKRPKGMNFIHKMYGKYFRRGWAKVDFFSLSNTLSQLKRKPDCWGNV